MNYKETTIEMVCKQLMAANAKLKALMTLDIVIDYIAVSSQLEAVDNILTNPSFVKASNGTDISKSLIERRYQLFQAEFKLKQREVVISYIEALQIKTSIESLMVSDAFAKLVRNETTNSNGVKRSLPSPTNKFLIKTKK